MLCQLFALGVCDFYLFVFVHFNVCFILLGCTFCFLSAVFSLTYIHCIPVAIVWILVTVCMPSCIYILFAQFLYMPDDAKGVKRCRNVCTIIKKV